MMTPFSCDLPDWCRNSDRQDRFPDRRLFYGRRCPFRIHSVFCPKVYDYEETVETLQRVFGIVGICPMRVISDKRFETICQETANYVAEAYKDRKVTF